MMAPNRERLAMSSAIEGLLNVLDLEQLEVNLFRGRSPPTDRLRVYGGRGNGQGLVAPRRALPDGGGPPATSRPGSFPPGAAPREPTGSRAGSAALPEDLA